MTSATDRLQITNIALAILHAAQAVVVVVLANDFALPVTATFMDGPPGGPPALSSLFEVRVAWGVAAFLLMSAVAHATIALPGVNGWYRRHLAEGRNYARWIEYSFSSTVMIVLIAMITGITDVAALVGLAGANAAMILFGLIQERYERPGTPSWLPFGLGSLIGVIPWVAIGVYLFTPGVNASPPAFVYAIYVSLFAFFNVFALNMVLQYRARGRWADYLFGERVYMLLSLTAKSALAWQVFASTLAV
ncbi:MAG TPA: heliorhodopsin HeR [Acidimicrobiia bacterium]|nr:heliorhodopsin HeR [Acidimicrobiia bacterium]